MSTNTKPTARSTARPTAKPAPTTKAKTATKAAPKSVVKKAAPKEPTATTLLEALIAKEAVLIKKRANGTIRSLPYLAPGSEVRTTAQDVAGRRTKGDTIEKIAEDIRVSVATVRRYVTGLELAQEVEAGKYDKAWKKGEKQVAVHTVSAKQATA
jgi:hypothetical protein